MEKIYHLSDADKDRIVDFKKNSVGLTYESHNILGDIINQFLTSSNIKQIHDQRGSLDQRKS